MRVYKFLNCKYGLRSLRERRLKISEIGSLNDPFDLIPFDLSDPELRKGIIASRNKIGVHRGLLCFSRHWHNPVMWAHYADSNKGLCLGFDLPDGGEPTFHAVDYIEQPIKLTHIDANVASKMLFTKYAHWAYEEEIRVWAPLEEKSGDHYFKAFDEQLLLREVIVGPANPVSKRRIIEVLRSYSRAVTITQARIAYDAFKIVQDGKGLQGVENGTVSDDCQ